MGGQVGTIIGHAACVLQLSRIASQVIPASKVSAPAAYGNSLSPGVVAPIMCATECSNSHPGLWRCSMAVPDLEPVCKVSSSPSFEHQTRHRHRHQRLTHGF